MGIRQIFLTLALFGFTSAMEAQSIGDFNSIPGTDQTELLVLPPSHTFQHLVKSGTPLQGGSYLNYNLDFTGYFPSGGSSTYGKLSISSEMVPATVAIYDASFHNSDKLWHLTNGSNVNFPFAEIGGVGRFCSGAVTPANHLMVCEEYTPNGDGNGDGYEDMGWIIEIDPVTREVIDQDNDGYADKLWAAGRQAHENACMNASMDVMYWGADAYSTGFIYKFIPTTPGDWSDGNLFVLVTTPALGTGTWVQIPNTTQAERNLTVTSSINAGAHNFVGIEDVELGPDGKIYFAAKGPGIIYRFTENGSSVTDLEIFVDNVSYDVDDAGPIPPEPWGYGNDNLCFDGDGNLWVLQDGSRNHIWVIGPGHTMANPQVKLFATTPAGSEPTGITFSPDYKYLFLSFQHPYWFNTQGQPDATGDTVVFDMDATIVISRKEWLGNTWQCSAVTGLYSSNVNATSVQLTWQATPDAVGYQIEYKPQWSLSWLAGPSVLTNTAPLTGLSPGTTYQYRVRSNCGPTSGPFTSGSFTTLPGNCPGAYDVNSNNTLPGAATIPFFTDVYGTISAPGDKDYYRFHLLSPQNISISLSQLPANFNLELRNNANALVASSSSPAMAPESINQLLGAGTWYAVVTSKPPAHNQALCYKLRLSTGMGAGMSNEVMAAEIENNSENKIEIFPNPATERLNIRRENSGKAQLYLFSPQGTLVLTREIKGSLEQIDISTLPAGAYLVEIREEAEIGRFRVIKGF